MTVEVLVSRTRGPSFVLAVGQARAAADAGDAALLVHRHHPIAYVTRTPSGYRTDPATLPAFAPPRWVAQATRILTRSTAP